MALRVMSPIDRSMIENWRNKTIGAPSTTSSIAQQHSGLAQVCPAAMSNSSWDFSSLKGARFSPAKQDDEPASESDRSWPDGDQGGALLPSFRPSKRIRSPSPDTSISNKRHQPYNSPGNLQPSRAFPAQSFFSRYSQEDNDMRDVRGQTYEASDGRGSYASGVAEINKSWKKSVNEGPYISPASRLKSPHLYINASGTSGRSKQSDRNPYGSAQRDYHQPSSHSAPRHKIVQKSGIAPYNSDHADDTGTEPRESPPYDRQSRASSQTMAPPQQMRFREGFFSQHRETTSTPQRPKQNTSMLASPIWPNESSIGRQSKMTTPAHHIDRSLSTSHPAPRREQGFVRAPRTPLNSRPSTRPNSPDGQFETFNSPDREQQNVPHVNGRYMSTTSSCIPIHQKKWRESATSYDSPRATPKARVGIVVDLCTPIAPQSRRTSSIRDQQSNFNGNHVEDIQMPDLEDPEMPPLEGDATPIESLIRSHTKRFSKLDQAPYNPVNVLPARSMYDCARDVPPSRARGSTPHQQIPRQQVPRQQAPLQQPPSRQAARQSPAITHDINSRPSGRSQPTTFSKQALSRGGGPESPINLSTPEDNTRQTQASPMQRSIPMKQRLPPTILKRATPLKPRSDIATKRRQPVHQEQRQTVDPEIARQRRAAELVVQRECQTDNEAIERTLFGELLGENPEEQQKRWELRRAEGERRRQAREKVLADQAEALRVANEEKRLLEEKIAEQDRLIKQREEERKRAKRDEERKRQAKIDERIMEEKRRKAQEKILADRAREKAEQDAKALEREKAATIQAEAHKLAELKLKQEAARLQASSLKSASIFPPDECKRRGASATADNGETLFITEEDDKGDVYDVDERARAKISGPTSAMEFVANNPDSWLGRPTFQQLREEYDRQRKIDEQKRRNEACAKRLELRKLAKAEEAALSGQSTSPKRRAPAKKSNMQRAATTQRHTKQAIDGPSIYSSQVGIGDISASNLPSDSIAPVSRSRQTTAKLPKHKSKLDFLAQMPAQRTYASFIKTADDIAREEKENIKKSKRPSAQKTEKEKEERRKREAEKSREKARAKIEADFIENARKAGHSVSEDEVKKFADVEMMKRDEVQRKRNENKASREGRSSSQTSAVPQQAFQNEAPPEVTEANGSEFHGDHPNEQQTSETNEAADYASSNTSVTIRSSSPGNDGNGGVSGENNAAASAHRVAEPMDLDTQNSVHPSTSTSSLNASRTNVSLSKGMMIAMASTARRPRNPSGRFANLPRNVTVDCQKGDSESESSSSDESEEDPDDEDTIEAHRKAVQFSKPDREEGPSMPNMNSAVSDELGVAAIADQGHYSTQIEKPMPNMTEYFQGRAASVKNQESKSSEPAKTQNTSSGVQPKANHLIHVYIVKQGEAIDDTVQLDAVVDHGKLHDRNEANDLAAAKVKEYRLKHGEPRLVDEYFDDNLYHCKLAHDDHNATFFYIIREILPTAQIPHFNADGIKPIIQERAWMIHVRVITITFDEAGHKLKTVTDQPRDGYYSDQGYANKKAHDYLFEYVKPTSNVVDHLEQHENELRKHLKDALELYNINEALFEAELEVSEESLPWMATKGLESICVYVKEQPVVGPTN